MSPTEGSCGRNSETVIAVTVEIHGFSFHGRGHSIHFPGSERRLAAHASFPILGVAVAVFMSSSPILSASF